MLEREHLKKLKKFVDSGSKTLDLTKIILCTVALGEKLALNFYDNRKVAQAFSGLRRYKFVRHTKEGNYHTYNLTQKGEARLRDIIIDEIEIKSPKSWNGKWYLVMYDLPLRFKVARNAFRWKLKDLGFFQFQKSAWIYPYPCEKEILFVADFFGVRKYIEILEVDKVLGDKKLKAHFNL
jgi:DNA-binding transcriptional regulator PaaX